MLAPSIPATMSASAVSATITATMTSTVQVTHGQPVAACGRARGLRRPRRRDHRQLHGWRSRPDLARRRSRGLRHQRVRGLHERRSCSTQRGQLRRWTFEPGRAACVELVVEPVRDESLGALAPAARAERLRERGLAPSRELFGQRSLRHRARPPPLRATSRRAPPARSRPPHARSGRAAARRGSGPPRRRRPVRRGGRGPVEEARAPS